MRRSKPELDARKASANRLAELLGEHRRLWMARSRYGGLEQSSDQYRRLIWSY